MDEAIRIGHLIEFQHIAAQLHGARDLAFEKRVVDGFVGIGTEHAQRNPRMAIVETAAGKGAVAVDDVDDAAGLRSRFGFLDHLLKNPGMVRAPFDFQANDGIGGLIHARMIADAALTPPCCLSRTPQ